MSLPSLATRFAAFLSASSLLAGCVSGPAPANFAGSAFAPGQHAAPGSGQPQGAWTPRAQAAADAGACTGEMPAQLAALTRLDSRDLSAIDAPLAPGDRLRIAVLGDTDDLSGTYVIDTDGGVTMDGAGKVAAAGLSLADFEARMRDRLIGKGIVRQLTNAVRVTLIEQGGVGVAVTGAVFQSGALRTGERAAESRVGLKEGMASGDDNAARTLTSAIRAAGGVRPDADVARVYLIRGSAFAEFDMRGFVEGSGSKDVALTSGDRIIVPSRHCFDPQLVRPTPLTQPGIRVYMSNLTRSANNNAGAAIGEKTTSLPYGTRLLQALVAANCVGGSFMQADRRAVLISRNPMTGDSMVIERDIEKLVRNADRDSYDPFLMPNDAIACYDSRWTNLSEAIGMVSSAVNTATPALLVRKAIQ